MQSSTRLSRPLAYIWGKPVDVYSDHNALQIIRRGNFIVILTGPHGRGTSKTLLQPLAINLTKLLILVKRMILWSLSRRVWVLFNASVRSCREGIFPQDSLVMLSSAREGEVAKMPRTS